MRCTALEADIALTIREQAMIWLVLVGVALAEIAGCFAFWAVWRLGASPLWLVPGLLALAAFAWGLTLVPGTAAGRVYAGYGGIYVAASILWLWLIEGQRPDVYDLAGGAIILAGAAVILGAPR